MIRPTALQRRTAQAQQRARDLATDPSATPAQREQAANDVAVLEQQLRDQEPGVLVGDMEPTEADKEALSREVIEADLRSAYAQWTGGRSRTTETFDEWLRTIAIENPEFKDDADLLIKAQDIERLPTKALREASAALNTAIEAFSRANKEGDPVESLLILPLLRAAVEARGDTERLITAKEARD